MLRMATRVCIHTELSSTAIIRFAVVAAPTSRHFQHIAHTPAKNFQCKNFAAKIQLRCTSPAFTACTCPCAPSVAGQPASGPCRPLHRTSHLHFFLLSLYHFVSFAYLCDQRKKENKASAGSSVWTLIMVTTRALLSVLALAGVAAAYSNTCASYGSRAPCVATSG